MKTIAIALTLLSVSALARKPIPTEDIITPLLEGRREIISLGEIDRLSLNSGKTSLDLWSGSYWPHYQGSLGVRYRDSSFSALIKTAENFSKYKELYDTNPLYVLSGREGLMSPAEKYDLIVGDPEMSLTKYSWELGEKAMSLSGKVPTWRGICDGWSSAAQKMPRPARSVVLKTPYGLPITFYPEDIKALGSQLYARAQRNVIFLGKRCRPVFGALTGACDGTNPGAFHKAIVNRVGAMKKSFNVDISSSSEVWNYPVKSYKLSYYNVLTGKESQNFKDVYEVFDKKNRFKKKNRRHESTYAIVGVKAQVVYTDMRVANVLETDSAAEDKELVKNYKYDLELDYGFNILGGEWESAMPDFIWAPNDLTYPISEGERQLGKPVTAAQILRAAQISSKAGEPLSMIVEKLFEGSKL